MAVNGSKKPWEELARELAGETNPERVTELAEALSLAVDEHFKTDQTSQKKPIERKSA